jgi:hypothetical protein
MTPANVSLIAGNHHVQGPGQGAHFLLSLSERPVQAHADALHSVYMNMAFDLWASLFLSVIARKQGDAGACRRWYSCESCWA